MKKIILILMSCFLFMGCNQNVEDAVKKIYFITGDNKYEVIENKYQEIVDYLKTINSIKHDSIESVDDFWAIQVDEQMIYLNEDGSFIINGNKYIPDNTTLIDMYKDALGYDIFLGAYMLSEEWIINALENKKIFCFNSNNVKQVFIDKPHKQEQYYIRKDKIEDVIKIFNEVETYPYIEYGSMVFGIPEHNFVVEYNDKKYSFSIVEVNDSHTLLLQYIYNKDKNPSIEIAWIYLDSPKLSNFYEELLGCRAHSSSEHKIIPNKNWIEIEK